MGPTPNYLKKLKIAELREECQKYGIDTRGTKTVLLNKLLEHLGHDRVNTSMEDSELRSQISELNEISTEKEDVIMDENPHQMVWDDKISEDVDYTREGSIERSSYLDCHEDPEYDTVKIIVHEDEELTKEGEKRESSKERFSKKTQPVSRGGKIQEHDSSQTSTKVDIGEVVTGKGSLSTRQRVVISPKRKIGDESRQKIESNLESSGTTEISGNDRIKKRRLDEDSFRDHSKRAKNQESENGENIVIPQRYNFIELDHLQADLHLCVVPNQVPSTFAENDNMIPKECPFTRAKMFVKNDLYNFWCGVKANIGLSVANIISSSVSKKIVFACQINQQIDIKAIPGVRSTYSPYGFRVGWSSQSSDLHLGSGQAISCGYDSSGKLFAYGALVKDVEGKSCGKGKKYSVNDIVVCQLDCSSKQIKVSFTVNGEDSGVFISLPELSETDVLYPHVYFKNIEFTVAFKETEFSSIAPSNVSAPPGTVFIGDLPIKSTFLSHFPAESSSTDTEHEVILMSGVIASGKTHYVNQIMKQNENRRYYSIGRSLFFNRWKDSWDDGKISMSEYDHLSEKIVSRAINKFLSLAPSRPRNYIIDQTNCVSHSRKRKIAEFSSFKHRIAVLVAPCLSDHASRMESYKKDLSEPRADKRSVHLEDVAQLKRDITVPTLDEGFTSIKFVDCSDEEAAKKIIEDYHYDAKKFFDEKREKAVVAKKAVEAIRSIPIRRRIPPKIRPVDRNAPISRRGLLEVRSRPPYARQSGVSDSNRRFADSPPFRKMNESRRSPPYPSSTHPPRPRSPKLLGRNYSRDTEQSDHRSVSGYYDGSVRSAGEYSRGNVGGFHSADDRAHLDTRLGNRVTSGPNYDSGSKYDRYPSSNAPGSYDTRYPRDSSTRRSPVHSSSHGASTYLGRYSKPPSYDTQRYSPRSQSYQNIDSRAIPSSSGGGRHSTDHPYSSSTTGSSGLYSSSRLSDNSYSNPGSTGRYSNPSGPSSRYSSSQSGGAWHPTSSAHDSDYSRKPSSYTSSSGGRSYQGGVGNSLRSRGSSSGWHPSSSSSVGGGSGLSRSGGYGSGGYSNTSSGSIGGNTHSSGVRSTGGSGGYSRY